VDFPVRSRSLLRKHRAPNFVFAVARFRCRVKARHGRSFRRGARFLQRASQFTVGFDPTARAGITVRGTVSRFRTSFSLRDPSSCVAVSSVQDPVLGTVTAEHVLPTCASSLGQGISLVLIAATCLKTDFCHVLVASRVAGLVLEASYQKARAFLFSLCIVHCFSVTSTRCSVKCM
jgi:hypothetical protein